MEQTEINGITLSYTVKGQGKPILLVHGNGEDHRIFDRTVDILKEHYTCWLIDSRGHGRSSRVSELHYREMAQDMILFIEEKGLTGVTLAGFSDGGIIGLLAASMSPAIRTLITCGANLHPEGLKSFFTAGVRLLTVFSGSPRLRLMLDEPDISDRELRRIKADTLVIAGQHDVVRKRETDHIAETIPHAEERILPGETHTSYVVHSPKLGHIILDYMKRQNA